MRQAAPQDLLDPDVVRERTEAWTERHVVPLLRRPMIWWKLRDYRRAERARGPARESALRTLRREYVRARDAGMADYADIHNLGLFVVSLDQDLAAAFHSSVHEHVAARRSFHVRQLACLLYEAADDLPQLLGRKFRSTLKRLALWDGALDELGSM